MGFPLSTDIFGQLAWLVNQVKLLVFRVTRIEQGGGGGAQNIDQVLTTGNTATNKTLINTVLSSGVIYTSSLSPYSLYIEETTGGFTNYTTYGRSQIVYNDNTTSASLAIGRTEGYSAGLGFTITNGAGGSISCDPTQYVITSSTAINKITSDSINVVNPSNSGDNLTLTFNTTIQQIKTTINDTDVGLHLNRLTSIYTIGEELGGNTNYFGINTTTGKLIANGILQTGSSYNNPTGFIEIVINSNSYWIEVWT